MPHDIAKLFMNGRSQAVRLPAAYRFEGNEVYVRRDLASGDVILSKRPAREDWELFFRTVEADRAQNAGFLQNRDQGVLQERDWF